MVHKHKCTNCKNTFNCDQDYKTCTRELCVLCDNKINNEYIVGVVKSLHVSYSTYIPCLKCDNGFEYSDSRDINLKDINNSLLIELIKNEWLIYFDNYKLFGICPDCRTKDDLYNFTKYQREIYLICDNCSFRNEYHLLLENDNDIDVIIKFGKEIYKLGWVSIDGNFICPKCAEILL